MKFYFETYGCTSNRADTDLMKGIIEERGHKTVSDPRESDVSVINTCIVIGKTENRMLNRIKELSETGCDLVVSGCLSATGRKKIKEIDESIKIFTPDEPGRITEFFDEEPLEKKEAPSKINGVVGRIQIAEGCLGNCAYCITKYARGSLTSFPEKNILEKIRSMVDQGAKEIRLTAQDTGDYGKDIGTDLPSLLSKISEIEGDFNVRVGMMNPRSVKDFFDEVVEEMRDPCFYNFLHIPVQSGSKKVLEKMKRGYEPEIFEKFVETAREEIGATVSTDVITGFPGETEKEFEKTVNILERTKPDIINITRYSERPGTEAAEMKHPSHNDSKKRSKRITELRNRICGEMRRKRVGKTVDATVIEKGKPGSVIARDKYYTPIVVQKDLEPGESIEVKIRKGKWSYVEGTLEDRK